MSRYFHSMLPAILLIGFAWAQAPNQASPQASQPAASSPASPEAPAASSAQAQPIQAEKIPAGTIIPAELSKSADAKKLKTGDKIEAKTSMDLLSHGQIVIPRNTKIVGHVTEAKAHSKESPDSSLGLAFDRITMKDGRELQMQASVQAIGRPLQSAAMPGSSAPAPSAGGMPAGGPSGGPMGSPSGPSAVPLQRSGTADSYPAGGGGMPSSPEAGTSGGSTISPLSSNSQGVVGMKGLSLSASGQGSVVSSSTQNVHLDSGTQLILKTQ